MSLITLEQTTDSDAIEILLDQAFGPGRQSKISYSYRAGVERIAALCLVARDCDAADAGIIGTIRYWPIAIGKSPALLLGPVAVQADRQSEGLGGRLIRTSLDLAAGLGYRAVLLVGDESYYGRFGFRSASRQGAVMPRENPARVLALSLDPARLDEFPSGLVRPWRSVRRVAA